MITGYNTDVEHDGVVYHVQTEDKGLDAPLILSLVYSGGEILASKRSPYTDLIESGFNEQVLAERLKRQHRLICAAILAGRVEDLKRMGAREEQAPLEVSAPAKTKEKPARKKEKYAPAEEKPVLAEVKSAPTEDKAAAREEKPAREKPAPAKEKPTPVEVKPPVTTADSRVQATGPPTRTVPGTAPPKPPSRSASQKEAYSIHDSRRQSPLGHFDSSTEGLRVTFLDDKEFRSGDSLTLGILVTYKAGDEEKPLSGVPVSVKLLGTTFRPVILLLETQRDGIAVASTQIPPFNSGRAAILVRATKDGAAVEIRRVIYPAAR